MAILLAVPAFCKLGYSSAAPAAGQGIPFREVQSEQQARSFKAQRSQIKVGKQSADAGEVVSVPIHFTPLPDAAITSLSIDITYNHALEFLEVSGDKKVVTAAEVVPAEAGLQTVRARFRVEAFQGRLTEGRLGFLVFRIRKDAASGRIPLRVSVAAPESKATARAPELESLDGLVEVLPPRLEDLQSGMENLDPYIPACFFYMH